MVAQHARQQSHDRIDHHHCGDGAIRQHIIADAQFLIHARVDDPLVHAFIVSAEKNDVRFLAEPHRIGLLNHVVPCAELKAKTMWLGTMIAKNKRESIMGVKALMLQDLGRSLEEQWANERSYTTNVMRGAKAENAFPDFIARKGRPLQREA